MSGPLLLLGRQEMPTDVVAQGASLPDWRGRRHATGPTSRDGADVTQTGLTGPAGAAGLGRAIEVYEASEGQVAHCGWAG
jgi:hypothetical protein